MSCQLASIVTRCTGAQPTRDPLPTSSVPRPEDCRSAHAQMHTVAKRRLDISRVYCRWCKWVAAEGHWNHFRPQTLLTAVCL